MSDEKRNEVYDTLSTYFFTEESNAHIASALCSEFERDARRFNRAFYEEREVSTR